MTNAHVSLQDFRHRLRRHLLGGIPGGPDGGGAPWLDGLVMEYLPSGNVLRITFPHIYFARWFAPHKTDFSAAVKAAWPDADAPRLEYVLPGRRLPRGPAPQVAPARSRKARGDVAVRLAVHAMPRFCLRAGTVLHRSPLLHDDDFLLATASEHLDRRKDSRRACPDNQNICFHFRFLLLDYAYIKPEMISPAL